MARLAFILFIILPMHLLAQQGATCETAIAADDPGFSFPARPSASTWYKFTAKERRCRLSIPAGASFLLFEDEQGTFCSSVKQAAENYNVLATRGMNSKTSGIALPAFTAEELNGKCACDICAADPYRQELWLKKNATYYLLMLSQPEGVKLEYIHVPVSDAGVIAVDKDTNKKPADTVTVQIGKKLDDLKAGEKVTLNNILFYPGTASLLPGAETDLDALLLFMKTNKTVKIQIEGHIHGYPSDDPDEPLSLSRARVVYEHLIKNGIEKERLTYRSYGTTRLLYKGADPQKQQQNRRVEVLIISK